VEIYKRFSTAVPGFWIVLNVTRSTDANECRLYLAQDMSAMNVSLVLVLILFWQSQPLLDLCHTLALRYFPVVCQFCRGI